MTKRKYELDVLRVLAAVAVVVFHVLASSVNNDPMVSGQMHRVITAISATLQWHVPVFFMITGYLWLGEEKDCNFHKMYPNIRRFVLVLFTIGFSYAMLERIFALREISFELLLLAFRDVLLGNLWDHMWYIYSIIGIYLFLPVLKPFFVHGSRQAIMLFTGLLYLFNVIIPSAESVTLLRNPIDFPVTAPAFYVCIGGVISKLRKEKKDKLQYTIVSFCCSIVAIFLIELYIPEYNSWISLIKSISAVSIFLSVIDYFSGKKELNWLRKISECSFGIYLFHPFFINLMIKVFRIYPVRWCPPVSLFLTSAGIVGLSYMTTYFLRKIRLIRKYIL